MKEHVVQRWGVGMFIVLITLLILLLVFGPLAIVWALNTLFPVVAIPYNFYSWLAVVVLNLTWFFPKVQTK
jgi:hypothetical protein